MKQLAIAFLALAVAAPAMAHEDSDAYVGTSIAAYASDKGETAERGIVIDGSYGMVRTDTSFSDLSVSTNDVWNLGLGYMWQPSSSYAQGVIVSVNRYNGMRFKLDDGTDFSVNANAYDVVYAGEYKLSRHVAVLFSGGYSLLETKAEKGGEQATSNGVTGSAGLAYIVPAGSGETMVYIEAQGARYFDFYGESGATAAIVGANVGIRHRF